MIQTLLIQVQKTKVDVDLAMTALDKLLKSNELNFAFLGKIEPKIVYTYLYLTTIILILSCRSFHVVHLGYY